jgi:glycosyltransferase involved in cell wall biosynthesis
MRVLVAQIPMPRNRFLVDLNAELAKRCELTHDCDAFWQMTGGHQVVHLHFPEYLTYQIEQAYQQGLTDELIAETEIRLRWWAERATLVVTRHVLLPHDALEDPMWEKMYAMFYRYVDGVAHFAQASIDEFRERYGGSDWFRGCEPLHAVIPHHNYASLPNTISREEARQRLGIPLTARVVLAFGMIRNDAERELILRTFRSLGGRGNLLLVSRWREKLRKISWIRLKYWVRDLTRLYYRLHPSYHFNYGFVEEEDTQLYLNAADVLFIPRLWVLNSGNVTLGMTFGRVVVGPDSWDVGQLLRETGNPVFDPDQPATAAAAVEEGLRLAAAGKVGAANRELALREWGADTCAGQYVELYQRTWRGERG